MQRYGGFGRWRNICRTFAWGCGDRGCDLRQRANETAELCREQASNLGTDWHGSHFERHCFTSTESRVFILNPCKSVPETVRVARATMAIWVEGLCHIRRKDTKIAYKRCIWVAEFTKCFRIHKIWPFCVSFVASNHFFFVTLHHATHPYWINHHTIHV